MTWVRAKGEGRAIPEPPAECPADVAAGHRREVAGGEENQLWGQGCRGQPGLQSGVQAAVLRLALESEGEPSGDWPEGHLHLVGGWKLGRWEAKEQAMLEVRGPVSWARWPPRLHALGLWPLCGDQF